MVGRDNLTTLAPPKNVEGSVEAKTCLGFLQATVLLIGSLVALQASFLQNRENLSLEIDLTEAKSGQMKKNGDEDYSFFHDSKLSN